MSQESPYMSLVFEQTARADAAEARSKELESQCAAMREAMELAANALEDSGTPCRDDTKHERCEVCYAANACRYALSGDAGRALLERVEALERDIAEKSERCSRGAHALIESIGADGPEHIDETCARASRRIVALERVADAARKYVDSDDEDRASEFDAMSSALDAMETKR